MINPWNYYHKFLTSALNTNVKIIDNIVSMTHAISSIVCMGVLHGVMYLQNSYNDFVEHNAEWDTEHTIILTINMIITLSYYMYDLKNQSDSVIVYVHHIVASLLIPIAIYYEPPYYITLCFGMIEVSNIPLYITQFFLWDDDPYWRNHHAVKYCILAEIISFIIFRCILLFYFMHFKIQSWIVICGIEPIYIGSLYWTYKLLRIYNGLSNKSKQKND